MDDLASSDGHDAPALQPAVAPGLPPKVLTSSDAASAILTLITETGHISCPKCNSLFGDSLLLDRHLESVHGLPAMSAPAPVSKPAAPISPSASASGGAGGSPASAAPDTDDDNDSRAPPPGYRPRVPGKSSRFQPKFAAATASAAAAASADGSAKKKKGGGKVRRKMPGRISSLLTSAQKKEWIQFIGSHAIEGPRAGMISNWETLQSTGPEYVRSYPLYSLRLLFHQLKVCEPYKSMLPHALQKRNPRPDRKGTRKGHDSDDPDGASLSQNEDEAVDELEHSLSDEDEHEEHVALASDDEVYEPTAKRSRAGRRYSKSSPFDPSRTPTRHRSPNPNAGADAPPAPVPPHAQLPAGAVQLANGLNSLFFSAEPHAFSQTMHPLSLAPMHNRVCLSIALGDCHAAIEEKALGAFLLRLIPRDPAATVKSEPAASASALASAPAPASEAPAPPSLTNGGEEEALATAEPSQEATQTEATAMMIDGPIPPSASANIYPAIQEAWITLAPGAVRNALNVKFAANQIEFVLQLPR